MPAHALAAWPPLTRRAAQLPEDEDELASVMSRGDVRRMARDASIFLGTAEPEEAPGSEMKTLRAPQHARFAEDEEDD